MISIKQNRSWSKPDNIPALIARKKVDWSIFVYGSHIPLNFHEDFEKANNGIHIELGKSQELELIIEGNSYQASLMNIDRKQVDYDTYQIRYDGKNEIKELFQKRFRPSYQYLKAKRENSESNKQHIVPEEKSEYIEFYETGEPFKYELKLIKANRDLAGSMTEGVMEVGNTEEIINTGKIINNINNYISTKGFTYLPGLIENFYFSLKTKPFVLLAGVSGTGKTKLVKLFAEAINCTEENGRLKLISVRPDWSDSSDLLGYKNIKDEFQPGPMIDILKAAITDPDNIYFVCLDEMNLARVEYYFSDFLSIMETRKKDQEARILTSKLLSEKDFAKDDDIKKYSDLIIPDNLYIVGTVNMDETTHPFSKKVLDRANTIEFSEINLLDYSLASNDDDIEIETIEAANDFLRSDYITLNDCSKEDNKLISELVEKLQEINDILSEASLQVGYRVRDEFCFYMLYNQQEELLDEEQAFDFQLMQKILPRIQGSSRSIKNVLVKLFNFTADYNLSLDEGESGNPALDYVNKNKDTGTIVYANSAEKIAYMIKRIEEDGFTAYWL
ncbi:McrB family protein [Natronospora cellulosivora (SeqCode)]